MNTLFKCSRCGGHHERDEDGMIIESTKCAQEQNDEKQEEANRQPCSACPDPHGSPRRSSPPSTILTNGLYWKSRPYSSTSPPWSRWMPSGITPGMS